MWHVHKVLYRDLIAKGSVKGAIAIVLFCFVLLNLHLLEIYL